MTQSLRGQYRSLEEGTTEDMSLETLALETVSGGADVTFSGDSVPRTVGKQRPEVLDRRRHTVALCSANI